MRKTIIVVAAALALGAGTMATDTTAFARGGAGGHFGGGVGHFGGGVGHFGGGRFGAGFGRGDFGRGFRGGFGGLYGFGGAYGYGYGYSGCYVLTPYGYSWTCY